MQVDTYQSWANVKPLECVLSLHATLWHIELHTHFPKQTTIKLSIICSTVEEIAMHTVEQ